MSTRWRSRTGRMAILALLAVMLAACVAPVAARAIRAPDSVVSCLRAAELGDLEGFLDSFDLEKANESRSAYEAMYRIWLSEATNLESMEWEVAWTEPQSDGGQAVVIEVARVFDDRVERIPHLFVISGSGNIVYWAVLQEPRAY